MATKNTSADKPYNSERNINPSKDTGDMINDRNNNQSLPNDESAEDITAQKTSDQQIGDAQVNDNKLTDYTSNHSADA